MAANAIHQSPAQLARSIGSQSTLKNQPAKPAAALNPDLKTSDPKANKPTTQPSSVVNLSGNQKTKANEVYGPPAILNNAANSGGFTVAKTGQVEVEIKQSDSGYNNRIFWSSDNFKTRNYIGVDNQTGNVNLGSFKAGTKIDFGIENDFGQFFRTGGASQNVDKVDHTRSSQSSKGLEIGFEDLAGGGDRDFNDAVISVRSVNTPTPSNNSNRSGLADGSNPGQGAGRVNSPNNGTQNPANRSAAAPLVSNNSSPASSVNSNVKSPPTQVYSSAVLQNNNRSGLADGTNPSKAGSNNKSPNTGTLNPATANQTKTVSQTVNLQPKAVSALKAYNNVAQLVPSKPLNNPQHAIDKTKLEMNKVEKPPAAEVSAKSNSVKAAIATAVTQQNRSGLADGSNPGQGAGRINSPNLGANNPNQANPNQVNAMVAKR